MGSSVKEQDNRTFSLISYPMQAIYCSQQESEYYFSKERQQILSSWHQTVCTCPDWPAQILLGSEDDDDQEAWGTIHMQEAVHLVQNGL